MNGLRLDGKKAYSNAKCQSVYGFQWACASDISLEFSSQISRLRQTCPHFSYKEVMEAVRDSDLVVAFVNILTCFYHVCCFALP